MGREPLIREGMPVLVDDDLRLEGVGGSFRPAAVANRWLRELPVSGAPSPNTWRNYATALRAWFEFVAGRGVDPFGEREALRAVLSAYAGYRLSGPLTARWGASTWNLHIAVLASFYQWAVAEMYCAAVPFTFVRGRRRVRDGMVEVARNTAKLRAPKRHATVRYLEREFADMLIHALAGLGLDGAPDGFRGWETARNAAMGGLVLATGLRRLGEFTHLLVYEVPALPAHRSAVPVLFPVARSIAKGGKPRTTWIDYEALARVHQYIDLERAAVADGARWRPPERWGAPLEVSEPDCEGGRVNGKRVRWSSLSAAERVRLVAPEGGSCLLALRSGGAPFLAWPSVLARASARLREAEPRFPVVSAHRLRHSFAMHTLERLVQGYYQQAAKLVADADTDAALSLYLAKADPLMVLRDLLGHSSVTTSEVYLRRLDVTRIYRDAYHSASAGMALTPRQRAEVDAEFADDADGQG